jgi:hypothetical protein
VDADETRSSPRGVDKRFRAARDLGHEGEGGNEEEEEDLLRKEERKRAPARGTTETRGELKARAALRSPRASAWSARRLPQPGHRAPKIARKRHGGAKGDVRGSTKWR